MVVIIDNFDSFTYNVYQLVCGLTSLPVKVIRNNRISVDELEALNPTHLIISPGPGRPEEAGISMEAIARFMNRIPVLGICLGHQALGAVLGGKIVGARRIVHGETEPMTHDGKGLFRGISENTVCTRYHSLAVEQESLPDCLEITAQSADGEIMGIRHKTLPVEGVQFHPESMGSPEGKTLLENFFHYKKTPMDRKGLLAAVTSGTDLTRGQAEEFMDELTDGRLSPVFISAMLTAINIKGACPEEVAGCASALAAKKIKITVPFPVMDTCGTGGDGLGTFNISSLSALIAAAAGAKIAKHGNRAVSSLSGSADFYRELGLNIQQTPNQAADQMAEESFAFLFAPLYHSAMAHAAPVRRELGIKTIMNLVGPLSNPADAEYQLIGVYSSELCPVMARAARMLGVKRVMTVHSTDGLDEISVSAPTRIFFIGEDGTESDTLFDPEGLGIGPYTIEEIRGGDARANSITAREILEGRGPGAVREAVLLNAGAALMVFGLAGSIADGYRLALNALTEGKAGSLVERLTRKKAA